MKRASQHWFLITPLLGFLALVPVFYFSDLDLTIQDRYYDRETGLWAAAYRQPWITLNLHGELLGILLGLSAFSLLLLSVGRNGLHKFRKGSAFVLGTLLLGPGLLVNAVFKANWGRPRPLLVDRWDGDSAFEPFLKLDPSSVGNSFPSGHASMGFYTVVVALLFLAAGRRYLAVGLMVVSLAFGFVVGLSRIVSGKHFPSDVLFAGLLTWISAVLLYYLLGLHRHPLSSPRPPRPNRPLVQTFRRFSPALVGLLFCYPLVQWNYQSTSETSFEAVNAPDVPPLEIRLERRSLIRVRNGDALQFHCFTSGRGLIGSKVVTTPQLQDNRITFHQQISGLPEKTGALITVHVPPGRDYIIRLNHPRATSDLRAFEETADSRVQVIPHSPSN